MSTSPADNPGNPGPLPGCSIIIPTRDQFQFLAPCIESIEKSLGEGEPGNNIEIVIVDNGSSESQAVTFLNGLAGKPGFKVLKWGEPFNFSAINNFAARQCKGDILCFLNNDIEITDPRWLQQMLPLAAREDVGAVGCVLLYPDDSIQHAGVALDEQAIARHVGTGEAVATLKERGLDEVIAVDACTAACLFTRRSLFQKLGGFNEQALPVAYNDVDYCLRLGEKGLPVLLVPAIQQLHHESVSRSSDAAAENRERAQQEYGYMLRRWSYRIAGRQYESGLPEGFTEKNDTDAVIENARKDLFQDSGLALSETDRANIPAADDQAQWQRLYVQLEKSYLELARHSKQVEEAHRLVADSIFWKMTWPLRFIRNLFGGKQGNVETGAEAGTETDSAEKKTDPQALKALFDDSARQALDDFLASDKRLRFCDAENPRLTILLVLYNQAHLSLCCLQSILAQGGESYHLVIVDNASSDETAQLLDRVDNATIARNDENTGFVLAVNQGAQLAKGEYLLLLNNDAMLEANTIASALSVFESGDDIGAVGGKIKLLDGSLQEAGSIIFSDGACLGYGRGADPEEPRFNYRRDVDYCSGAFLLFRLETFEELGGFDEDYAPAYYEESDFCLRLRERELRVVYDPRAQITHYEFASSGGISKATSLQAEHQKILCNKHEELLAGQYANDGANLLRARTANRHPNVLVLDDRVPHPYLGAGYPRCARILHELSAMPLNLTFYPVITTDDSWQETYSTLPNTVEVMVGPKRPGLVEFLQDRAGFYDYVIVSRVHNMATFNDAVDKVPEFVEGTSIIYDAEAIIAPRDIMMRELNGETVSDAEKEKLVRAELAEARRARAILAVSEKEANAFRQHGYSQVEVLGHTLDLTPPVRDFESRRGILFVGALRDDHSPNVDSLNWFIDEIMPLISEEIPDIELNVVGHRDAPSLMGKDISGITFLGHMKSLDEVFETSRLFIAPTRYAAGIPHKVHEAASRGLPSVVTSLLADQLGWEHEQEILAANTAAEFAACCIRLYRDQSLWSNLQDKGLRAVERDCSELGFRETLHSLLA